MEIEPRVGPPNIYARKGEATYCENGHLLGHFRNDVHVGAAYKVGDLVPADGVEIGMATCPICGGRTTAGHGIYYFEKRA